LVRYPHRKRYAAAAEQLIAGRPRVLVDYGAGDGEMVARVLDGPGAESIELAVVFDPTPRQLQKAHKRLAAWGDRVRVVDDLTAAEAALEGRPIDAIACLGVLEHLSWRERKRFYRFSAEHLAQGGLCLIDVPVEIGPALLVKEFGRRALKGRPSGYARGQLFKPVIGFRVRDPQRFDREREDGWIQDHNGFDYRELRDELGNWMPVERSISTPIRVLPAWLCNQEVLLVARGRGSGTATS
jgi:hypothetical protein